MVLTFEGNTEVKNKSEKHEITPYGGFSSSVLEQLHSLPPREDMDIQFHRDGSLILDILPMVPIPEMALPPCMLTQITLYRYSPCCTAVQRLIFL